VAAPTTSAAAPAAPAPVGADEYKVRQGDTLSRIAGKTQRAGVSLDQMLVSLYRANPEAFVESNMNRLKAGVVLAVPSAEEAKAVPTAEARQVIQAQSADFGAYRQRLAGAVPAAKDTGSTRQAAGKVQTEVQDRKSAAAPAPDKLTLSKGAAAKAGAEDQIAKSGEKKDVSTRVAELSKNVAELKKLGAEAAKASVPATAATPAAPVAAKPALPAAASVPAVVATPAVKPAAPASVPAPAVAAAPAPVASAAVAAAPASVPVAAPVSAPVVAAASAPASAPIVAAAPAASVARRKKDSGETSFLESRLQPDSFFGASGGQRIDTRDAGGNGVVVDELLAEPARRHRRRRPGRRGRCLPGLRPRPAGRGDPQGSDARQPRAHGHPHQAARGLRQAPRHQGLRTAGHAALFADARARARTGPRPRKWACRSTPTIRCTSRAAQPERCRRAAARWSSRWVRHDAAHGQTLPSPSQFNASIIDSTSPVAPTWIWTSTWAALRRARPNLRPLQATQTLAPAAPSGNSMDFDSPMTDLTQPDIAPAGAGADARRQPGGRVRSRPASRSISTSRLTATRWRASSNWPRSSARSATSKARATCSRK
jgi:FimV-like protein